MYFLLISAVRLAADYITKRLSPNTLVGHKPSAGTLYPKQQSIYLKLINFLVAVCKAKNSAT